MRALALVLVLWACRPAASTVAAPRGLTGMLDVRANAGGTTRYALRVDRVPAGFVATLRPVGHGGPPGVHLERLPFAHTGDRANGPFVVETPRGTVTTMVAYRPLGPWFVLERAVSTVWSGASGGQRVGSYHVTLRDVRLEP
jgi:hypothetical protein